MPVKTKNKAKAVSKASQKTTVIVKIGEKRKAPARKRSNRTPSIAAPRMIGIPQQPVIIGNNNDAMLREIQNQISELKLNRPVASIATPPPAPAPVVAEVQTQVDLNSNPLFEPFVPTGESPLLPAAPMIGKSMPSVEPPTTARGRTPIRAGPTPRRSFPPERPMKEQSVLTLEDIPMEMKNGELKPKRGYGGIYKSLMRELKEQVKTPGAPSRGRPRKMFPPTPPA